MKALTLLLLADVGCALAGGRLRSLAAPSAEVTAQAFVDDETDGGGWVLLFAYDHVGGTNPELVGGTLPLDPLHNFSHALVEDVFPTFDIRDLLDVRFYGRTSAHDRVIHFKTDAAEIRGMALSTDYGFADASVWSSTFTLLNNHSAYLPAATTNAGCGSDP